MTSAVYQVFNIPELLSESILSRMDIGDLFNCTLVNKKFNENASACLSQQKSRRSDLLQHKFSKSDLIWIRELAKVPYEKIYGNTFLFACMFKGSHYMDSLIREELKYLNKEDNYKGISTRRMLFKPEQIETIVSQSSANVRIQQSAQEKFEGLLESRLLKKEHVERLQSLLDAQQLREAQMSYLCERGVVLMLAQNAAEIDLEAFLRVPDKFLEIEDGVKHSIHKLLDPADVSANLTQGHADEILSNMQQSQLFINIPNHYGETPIFREIRKGSDKAVERLLKLGARADFIGLGLGDTPMHAAASQATQAGNGDTRILKMLIDNGGEKVINQKNTHEETPWYCAKYNPRNAQHTETVVNFLVQHGAQPLDNADLMGLA